MAQSLLQKPIAQVAIYGNFNYMTKESVSLLVDDVVGKSFFSENIKQLQKKLQAHPWIDNISLSRQWPDLLRITIFEQVPIARWGNKGFVNNRGELIAMDNLEKLAHFAELDGDDKDAN